MSTVANQPAVAAGDADEFGGTQSLLKRVVGLQAFWILGVLIVICLFFTLIAGDRFLSTGNFSLISQNVAVWAVIGVGMTFVIITSGIDLSVGSVLVFSSVVAALLMEAIGSNEEAARRTGVKVTRHLVLVYALAGTLAGLGALLSLAQYGTTTIAGQSLTNLNVIAAVVIGGTSIFGGFGTIFGTVVGLFIPAVLQSGFVIIGVQPFWQGVAVGSVLIAAVYVDQTRRAAAMRSARSRGLFKRRGSK